MDSSHDGQNLRFPVKFQEYSSRQDLEELQKELVNLSTQGVQVIAEKSGHYIQWDQPDLVIDVIRQMVEQARSR